MTTRRALHLLAPAVLAALLAGCAKEVTCGPGTAKEGQTCVAAAAACAPGTAFDAATQTCLPDQATLCEPGTRWDAGAAGCVVDPAACAPGTTFSAAAGVCVPDATVLCQQGTRWDEGLGRCVVDPAACAAGTVLVAGACVPFDETLRGDLDEAAEPNDTADAPAGSLAVPAEGASVVLHGCIVPHDTTQDGLADPDVDAWLLTTTGPALLEITVDGVGGLAGGFQLEPAGTALRATVPGFVRIGASLGGDTARRQVFLPAAGTWSLAVGDARALLSGLVAGGPGACYFATVRRLPLPVPEPLVPGLIEGLADDRVRFLAYTAATRGELLEGQINFAPRLQTGLSWLSAAGGRSEGFLSEGGLEPGAVVTVALDPRFVLSTEPVPYGFLVGVIPSQPLPVGGGSVVVTRPAQAVLQLGTPSSLLYFDVPSAGTVVHLDVAPAVPVSLVVCSASNLREIVASVPTRADFRGEFVHFARPGRYYLGVAASSGLPGSTFTLASTLTQVPVEPVTHGALRAGLPVPSQGAAFHLLDPAGHPWSEFLVAGAGWGAGNVRFTAYDAERGAWLQAPVTSGVNNVFFRAQPAPGPAPFGRILLGDTRRLLLRVDSSAAPAPGATYDFSVRDRAVVDLGTTTPAVPLSRPNDALTAGGVVRFLARGAPGDQLVVASTPLLATADLSIQRLAVDETVTATVDAAPAGGTERVVLTYQAAPGDWVAWQVTNGSPAAAGVASSLSTTAPQRYTVTSGAIAYQDVCAAGTVLLNGVDEGVTAAQALPASFIGFRLLGQEVGSAGFRASSNGFLSFDAAVGAAFANQAIPLAAAPNGLLAPYWDDLTDVVLCRADGPGTVTLQWTGRRFLLSGSNGPAVAFQAVLHDDGVVDFVYGPGHLADGASATIGAEALAGLAGEPISFDAVRALAGTSWTLTPR